MAIAAFYSITQRLLIGLNTQFSQKFNTFVDFQALHEIFLHISRWILAGTLGPETSGKHHPTCAWLAIHGIDPFTHSWTINECVSGLPIEQVLKLVKEYQSRLVSSIERVKKSLCL